MCFKYALKFMSESLGRTILSMILAVMGILVIVFTAIIGTGTEYARNNADKLLTSGFEKTGIVRMEELDMGFINELGQQPEIGALGCFVTYTVNLPELAADINAVSGVSESGGSGNSQLDMDTVYYDTLNLFKMELQSGKFETEFPDDHTYYLYLGADYIGIPVGTVYRTATSTYTVAGIFKKSQRFISSELTIGFDQNHADYTFNCDSSIISACPYMFSSSFWLGAAENYTFPQAVGKAFEVAEKHGVEISYRTLRRSYEDAMINVLTMKNIFGKLMPVVCIACVVMILCMQISDIYSSLRGFGIMYSQGFSQKDLEKIMIWKNAVIFLISFIISAPLVDRLVNFWYVGSNGGTEVVRGLLLRYAAPAAILVILGIFIISVVFSIVVFRSYTPVEMIGGHND